MVECWSLHRMSRHRQPGTSVLLLLCLPPSRSTSPLGHRLGLERWLVERELGDAWDPKGCLKSDHRTRSSGRVEKDYWVVERR